MRRPATALGLALLLGCAASLERGERFYQQGDPLSALEVWREIPASHAEHPAARERVAAVERELARLASRYRQRGAFFADRERLAESVLNYRLALRLDPDDRETLARVQELSRALAERKRAHQEAFETAFREGRLAEARQEMDTLQALDPFDPDLSGLDQALEEEMDAEVTRRMERGREGFRAGDYAGAETAFRAVLELAPDHETARGYLGFIAQVQEAARHTGRPATAFRGLDFGATDAEIRAEGFYQNALVAERRGAHLTAIRYDLAAVQNNPDHRAAREHLARLRRDLQPQVETLIESGREAFVREDLETALGQWRQALLIDPDNVRARDYADRAERMLANLERLRAEPDVAAPVEVR